MPGSLDGRQFVMENLVDCTVHVMDHTATVNQYQTRLQSISVRTLLST